MTDTTDFLDIVPWPLAELAGHLVAQATLGRRALIETDTTAEVFERETDRFELDAWARLELGAWLPAPDLDLLGLPVGSLPEQVIARYERALITASTIAWALYLNPAASLPIVSDGSPELQVLEWAPTPWAPVRSVVKGLKIRTDEHLAAERERWEVIHWRTTLFEDPGSAEGDRTSLIETVAELGPLGLLATTGADLVLDDGQSFAKLGPEAMESIQADAETRLRALNWVCGFGESPTAAPLYLDNPDEN